MDKGPNPELIALTAAPQQVITGKDAASTGDPELLGAPFSQPRLGGLTTSL